MMTTLSEWYNIVAILMGVIMIYYIIRGVRRNTVSSLIISIALIPIALIFYAIWGGIFWW